MQTLYDDHLRGLVTLTPVTERLAVEQGKSQTEIERRSQACKANALPLRHRGGQNLVSEIELHIQHHIVLWGISLFHLRLL